jgi:hypothetical protein
MIVGEVTAIHFSAAILALKFVTGIDILPRKTDGVISKTDKMKEPDNRRQSNDESD